MKSEPILSGIKEISRVMRVRKETVYTWIEQGAPIDPEIGGDGKVRRWLTTKEALSVWRSAMLRKKMAA